ncbi:GNAT family N-acetyltransferase [Granulicella sp. S190]|uniref:GNAT family N-acetyltransferase n=1 Tax=Granulicella sp. S190 TaxID=1747226 RepID=UPI00131CE59A
MPSIWKKEIFLLLEEQDELIGLIYVELRENGHAYHGLLAIHPEKQSRGIGRQLLQTAWNFCRSNGCTVADAEVVNLRPDLIERYQRLGFKIVGEAPYHRPEILLQPCHFVLIQKDLFAVEP